MEISYVQKLVYPWKRDLSWDAKKASDRIPNLVIVWYLHLPHSLFLRLSKTFRPFKQNYWFISPFFNVQSQILRLINNLYLLYVLHCVDLLFQEKPSPNWSKPENIRTQKEYPREIGLLMGSSNI